MIDINKLPAPASLNAYRQQPDAEYDGPEFTPVKTEIRTQLLKEQGYLCAYCMARIWDDKTKTKVEHWQCQDNYSNRQLDYTNLLVVCKGNEGSSPKEQHCDTFKANKDLSLNPAYPSHRVESQIGYSGSGEIYSQVNEQLNNDLNNILNLNYKRLQGNRASVIKSVIEVLTKINGTATASDLTRLINRWRAVNELGQKEPYCGIAIHYLNKKLSKLV